MATGSYAIRWKLYCIAGLVTRPCEGHLSRPKMTDSDGDWVLKRYATRNPGSRQTKARIAFVVAG